MKITQDDLDNERVELPAGVWVFHANNLATLRVRLYEFIRGIPRTLDQKPYRYSKKKIKQRIRQIQNKRL